MPRIHNAVIHAAHVAQLAADLSPNTTPAGFAQAVLVALIARLVTR